MIQPPVCLTIAGSDPSGGAGIQGDLKTFAAHGAYGMAVITALTAQNTISVSGITAVKAPFVVKQLSAVYEDIPTDFAKTGMLLNSAIVKAISGFFSTRRSVRLIVDPVMISSSGAPLLRKSAINAYIKTLFPLSTLVTPNNMEACYLSKLQISSIDDAIRASEIIRSLGADNVLVKGGDTNFQEGEGKLYDVLNKAGQIHVFERKVMGARNSHGTGCALAAAICCRLAAGCNLEEAVDLAGRYVGEALKAAYKTGQGSGSINHLYNFPRIESTKIDDNCP